MLSKGASMVLLTAPGKGDIPNIVFGVNHEEYNAENEKIFSAASCTTNAVVPVIHVMENTFGIDRGILKLYTPIPMTRTCWTTTTRNTDVVVLLR